MYRLTARVSMCLAALTFGAAVAAGQSTGPTAGTWGAEGTAGGGATLLHFSSTSRAVLLSGSASHVHFDGGDFGADQDVTQFQLRAGIRGYRDTNAQFRPFSGIAAILGYQGSEGSTTWQYGLGGELGASYFFNPHVSLGTSAELSAIAGSGDSPLGRTWSVQLSGIRLLGAVYF